jgi:hypothetical protein
MMSMLICTTTLMIQITTNNERTDNYVMIDMTAENDGKRIRRMQIKRDE